MRMALNAMILQELPPTQIPDFSSFESHPNFRKIKENQNLEYFFVPRNTTTILLFPTWSPDWSVNFRLQASSNTVIEGSCMNGVLQNLMVQPMGRAADIIFIGCLPQNTMEE